MNKTFSPLLLMLFLFAGSTVQACSKAFDDPKIFIGNWEGKLNAGQMALRLVLHIKSDNGAYIGELDSPDQGAFGIKADYVKIEANTLEFRVNSLGVTYTGTLNEEQKSIKGWFKQGGANLPLDLSKTEKTAEAPKRPQNPVKPYPYNETEVTFKNVKAGVTLAGTFTSPKEGNSFPVVVLVTGSGRQNRDEELLGHKPFLVLADHLTRNGIAVLRFDDRGYGSSTGDFSVCTTNDFTDDALAAVEYLKTRTDINKKMIGIIGHSEGGMIAPLAASKSKDVAFIVMMAGPGIPGDELLVKQSYLIAKANGLPESSLKRDMEFNKKIFGYIKTMKDTATARDDLKKMADQYIASLPDSEKNSPEASPEKIQQEIQGAITPWFRFFMAYDPGPVLQKIKCPVLAINGGLDLQVPAKENLAEIERRLKKAGNKKFKVVELDNLNHLFQTAKTGSPSEYIQIEETMSPKALNIISDFIKSIK